MPLVLLTLVLAVLGFAGPVSTADPPPAGRPAAADAAPPAPAFETRPVTRSLQSVVGTEVVNMAGDGLGHIVDVLTDRDGAVVAAVIDFGGFLGLGSRKIAVAWGTLRFVGQGKTERTMLGIPRDVLRRAPEYKPGDAAAIVDVAN
jgi:hypothetical protein